MIGSSQIVDTVKRLLRSNQLTYNDVARALDLSEPSIKRLFASKRLTLDRLEQIADLLGMSASELLLEAESSLPRLHTLTREQEAQLAMDETLRLVITCVLNHWTMGDILSVYELSEAQCLRALLGLEKMGVIRLQAGNRIRLMVARDFDWLPDGPLRKDFLEKGLPEFLNSPFRRRDECLIFAYAMLTDGDMQQFTADLQKLRARLAALHANSSSAPLSEKRGTAIVLARRTWEPEAFVRFRRRRSVQRRDHRNAS
ncbi:helix-turn-helix transcriptional regulator [Caballeronia sp. LP003]|uniref:helix-turn-helix domain-containing protein n=1 Tax=Caballeronia sp. LP003 TaxID=3038551 RepID=UPI00285C51C4|nr:helix-turn-helix transcriptional regulator [Caballeronia sp. LP003]MDR5785502.1 helix-turn-helix transcriptional regulator [Caballeronia sp. LP003]